MATTTATSSSTSVLDKINNSRNSLASSEETFLKLLTTQMKNQDPLSPMDSNAFTGQIVQMTGVEQQLVTNDLLAALVGMNDGGLTNALGMMDKLATAETDKATIKNGKADWSYTQAQAGTSVKIEVLDKYGATIATKYPDDMSKGDHTFTWDGKSDEGTAQAEGGEYTLKITAINADGANITTSSKGRIEGIVTAVTNESGQNMVTIGGVKVPISSVIGVTNPPATTTS
ncbi:flagellar biosynthesis protein FlgD [Caulobacter sp. D4A]|uniref:flagellar hook assembly protein FlgD n=1 Tax=unclassified Caulobacter TaxID=2648921 RepID=UPI000D72FC8C|nr:MULTISPECIES: flagellar hook assembly protein FlgD [unclassified Caulobacter]PXA86437.1 flagellar biosynthesis protein FlgD [Caulobacter sp. D5]PXA94198.1 flagellar biosynthesis protein FlgD [Caulobacter sp. D4A]